MIFKAIICGCLVLGLTSARPQRASLSPRQSNNQFDSNQFNSGTNLYDNENGQNNENNNKGLRFERQQQYTDSRSAYITQYEYDNDGSGNYVYNVNQSDGIYNDQTGEVENQGTDDESSRVYGHYAYPGPDGKFYYVEYVADKDGFRPAGDHIPRSASVGRVGQLGIPSAAIASLAGGGLG